MLVLVSAATWLVPAVLAALLLYAAVRRGVRDGILAAHALTSGPPAGHQAARSATTSGSEGADGVEPR